MNEHMEIHQKFVDYVGRGDLGHIAKLGDQTLEMAPPNSTLCDRWGILTGVMPYMIPTETQRKSVQQSLYPDNKVSLPAKKSFLYMNAKTVLLWVNKNREELPDLDSRDELLTSIIVEILGRRSKLNLNRNIPIQLHRIMTQNCSKFRADNAPVRLLPGAQIAELREQDPTSTAVLQTLMREELKNMLAQLPSRMAQAITLRYSLDEADSDTRTLQEVVDIMRCSREKVRQCEPDGLRELRHYRYSRWLRDYFENPDNIRASESRVGGEVARGRAYQRAFIIRHSTGYPKPTTEEISREYHIGKTPVSVRTWKKLSSIGITMIGDLVSHSPEQLMKMWQSEGYKPFELAQAVDKGIMGSTVYLIDQFKTLTTAETKMLIYLTDTILSHDIVSWDQAEIHYTEKAAIRLAQGCWDRLRYTPDPLNVFEKYSDSDWEKIELRGRQKILSVALANLRGFLLRYKI